MDQTLIAAVSAPVVCLLLSIAFYSIGFSQGKEAGKLERDEHADIAARHELDAKLRDEIEKIGRQITEIFDQRKAKV